MDLQLLDLRPLVDLGSLQSLQFGHCLMDFILEGHEVDALLFFFMALHAE
jgi:hypothetical protein